MEKFIHIACDETNSIVQDNPLEEDAGFKEKDSSLEDEIKFEELEQTITPKDSPREWRTQKDLSLDNIIGEISKGVSTR